MTKFSVRCTDTIHHTEKEKTHNFKRQLERRVQLCGGFFGAFLAGQKQENLSQMCAEVLLSFSLLLGETDIHQKNGHFFFLKKTRITFKTFER